MKRQGMGIAACVCGIAAGIAFGQAPVTTAPSTAPATEASTMASTAPATQGASLGAGDKDGILKAVGTSVTITGTVSTVSTLSSGAITFVNFEGNKRGEFTVIIREDNKAGVDKGFGGDVATLQGKKIAVTGKVVKYRETPQIEVSKPEDVVVVK